VAGTAAAAVWGVLQPIDKLLLPGGYDDIELLGKAVVRDWRWYPAGFAIHIGNGAVFGAVYANVAPSVPLPPWARGPVLALAENFAGWPFGFVLDRLHPARDELPKLSGNRRALIQATWRHLVFGLVLGELERRLNAEPEPAPLEADIAYSSNGHGSLDRAVSVLVEPGS
jgi:hypothetical protein